MALDLQTAALNEAALSHARKDFVTLPHDLTVREALAAIRQHGVGEKIVYFYVLDDTERLIGVLPTRRLLIAGEDDRLADIMIRRVVTIPHTATVSEACEFFILYKFLALPVVDERQHILGIIDISLFTEEMFDLNELTEREYAETFFETLGFHISQIKGVSAFKAFRFRFPWLLITITNGTLCAVLTSMYAATLSRYLVLAFFMALVLGLNESVSIQSMTLTIQALRGAQPTFRWYAKALRKELGTAVCLGLTCGAIVLGIAWLWQKMLTPALVVGGAIFCSLMAACLIGLTIPTVLHAFRLDPKVAAGPITLALTDMCTLWSYLTLARMFLGK